MGDASTTDAGPGEPVLAGEFPPATEQRWLELVGKALSRGGAALEPAEALAKLRSRTPDGIEIEPLYTSADLAGPRPLGRVGRWEVRQPVRTPLTNERVLEELEKGADGVVLDLGDEATTVDRLDRLLTGVLLDVASISLRPGSAWPQAASALGELWQSRGLDPSAARGSIGADPFGEHLARGGLSDLDDQLAALVTHASALGGSGVQLVTIGGIRQHLAGATDAEELGGVLAAALATLRVLADGGVPLADAFGLIELELAATAEQFATIAKFRAVRRLWARVADVVGVPAAAAATRIHATSSPAMLSAYDPWVNLLRDTVACFAAGVAGADSISVLPYDDRLARTDDELGRRLARNTQSILALESNLGQVADPAGGSWYVERLTDEVAAAGWAWLQQIEAVGGFRAAAESGMVADRLAASWAQRTARIDSRRDPLTGVSEFPNIAEPPAVLRPTGETIVGLPVHHQAERFETLRLRVDAFAAAGSRPTVFLAAIGAPAQTTARVSFAKNLFEVGGVRTVEGPATTDPEAIAAAFAVVGATVACLCSSDAVYDERAGSVVDTLRAAGATRIYLAGKPPPALADAGVAIDAHIAAGGDVHTALDELLTFLEVP